MDAHIVSWIDCVALELDTSDFSSAQLKEFCVPTIKILLEETTKTQSRADKFYICSITYEFMRRNWKFTETHGLLARTLTDKLIEQLTTEFKDRKFEFYKDHWISCFMASLRNINVDELHEAAFTTRNYAEKFVNLDYIKNSHRTVRAGCVKEPYEVVIKQLKEFLQMISYQPPPTLTDREEEKIRLLVKDAIEQDFEILESLSDLIEPVYICQEKTTKKQVVIKYRIAELNEALFYRDCSEDPAFVETFSFQIIPVKHFVFQEVDKFVVIHIMERFGEGKGIREVLLTAEELEQIEDMIMCLHDRGLYHGDLQPDNILFDCVGSTKIFKFIDPYYYKTPPTCRCEIGFFNSYIEYEE